MVDKERVRAHFEHVAPEYDAWKRRARYYYAWLARILREEVPAGARVLDIGCGTGALLAAVQPAYGLGLDLSPAMVRLASVRFPHLRFRIGDADGLDVGEPFDFVLMVDVLEHLSDPQAALTCAHRACQAGGQLVLLAANPAWRPILHLAERLGLKMPEGDHRWLAAGEVRGLLDAVGFDVIREARRVLVPKRIPLLAWIANEYLIRVPIMRSVGLVLVFVACPRAA